MLICQQCDSVCPSHTYVTMNGTINTLHCLHC